MKRQPQRSVEGTRDLRLLHAITVIANEAATAEWAMERAIERICSDGDWPVGHVYLESPDEPGIYRDQGIWWLESHEAFRLFVRASAAIRFRRGAGFVGSIIDSGRAGLLPDFRKAGGLPRAAEAVACGIRTGVAFPILVERRVAGVMEFFSTRLRRVGRSRLQTLTQVGTHLGRIVERKELEREIAGLAAREQQRLGREIHDTLGQQVTAIEMLLKSFTRKYPPPPEAEATARRLVRLVEDTKRQVRILSRGLVPVEMDGDELLAALEDLAHQTSELHGVACEVVCDQPLEANERFTAAQLYRIAREGVHNAVKHGHPRRIVIRLSERDSLVTLQVRDDGRGPAPDSGNGSGRGLRIMTYRARSIGGTLKLERHPEGGALLSCTFRRRSAAAERDAGGAA